MIHELKPFRFWCQKILPLTYDESLSYYELLCKLVDYVNKLVENNNALIDAFNTLKKFVDDYFENLDLQEYINNKLDEMAENGFFENIVSIARGNNTSNEITLLRRAIWFEKNTRLFNEPTIDQNYTQMQGGCFCGDNVFIAYVVSTGSDTGRVRLAKYTSNFQFMAETFITCNHANSMCTDGTFLYLTNQDNVILVVDPTYMTVINSITIDSVENIYKIAYGANQFYISDNTKLYILNTEMHITEIHDLDFEGLKMQYCQDWVYYNGLLYSICFQNYMLVFKLDGTRVKTYNIGNWNTGCYVPEIEFIDVKNDNIYIGATSYIGTNVQYHVHAVFTCNLFKGDNGSYYNLFTYYTRNLYFDPNNTSVDQDGSQSKPFSNLQYCILESLNPMFKNFTQITMLGDYDDLVSLDNAQNVFFDCNYHSFPMLRVSHSVNITFRRANLVANTDMSYSVLSDSVVFGYESNTLTFQDCNINCANVAKAYFLGRCSNVSTTGTCVLSNETEEGILSDTDALFNFNNSVPYYAKLQSGSHLKIKGLNRKINKTSANTFVSRCSVFNTTNANAVGTIGALDLTEVQVAMVQQRAYYSKTRISALSSNGLFEFEFSNINDWLNLSAVAVINNVPHAMWMRVRINNTDGSITILSNKNINLLTGEITDYTSDTTLQFLKINNIWLMD